MTKFSIMAAIGLAVSIFGGAAAAQDSDGCYEASECATSELEWSGSTLIARVRNGCSEGIYVRLCILKDDGREDCGASHVAGGRTESFHTYNAHTSGQVNYRWVGSMFGSKDWVCSGKVSGWHDPMF